LELPMMLLYSWFSSTISITWGVTIKEVDEVPVFAGVVTAIGPEVAPVGTVVVIRESDDTVKVG